MAKEIVLDANIIIRAALGSKVRGLIAESSVDTMFYTPESAFQEVDKNLLKIFAKRKMNVEEIESTFDFLEDTKKNVLVSVPLERYAAFEKTALMLLARRDDKDWPYLALALHLGCPIWTEDRDFFGCGVAVWTTDRIKYFLEGAV
jgi:predicted nucleic acid-binding protein